MSRLLEVPDDTLLTPAAVATIFGVHPKSVRRWADSGALPSFKTPGGHRRFYAEDVRRLYEAGRSWE